MIAKIKQIFLQQYIGAIVTAFIAAQGLQSLIATIYLPVTVILGRVLGNSRRSVLGGSEPWPSIDWTVLASTLVNALLHLGAAYLLIRWLFWSNEEPHVETEENPPDSEPTHEIQG